jgi:Integrase core domain
VTLAARLRLPALYPSARWPRAAGFPCSISARNRGRWRWHCPSSQSAGRDDCVAGHVGLELRNVGKNYPFERSRRFPGIKRNFGRRDYSRLSCGGGKTQLGPSAGISAGFLERGRPPGPPPPLASSLAFGPSSPWQNGFAERLIGSIRRECADHVIALGEAHLRRILQAYALYYNGLRTHRSLDKDAPLSRPVQRIGCITSHVLLGGLHHRYCRI